jgi:hypothetical protein
VICAYDRFEGDPKGPIPPCTRNWSSLFLWLVATVVTILDFKHLRLTVAGAEFVLKYDCLVLAKLVADFSEKLFSLFDVFLGFYALAF